MRLRALATGVVMLLAFTGRAAGQQVTVTPDSGPGHLTVTLESSGFDSGGIGYNTGFYLDGSGGPFAICPTDQGLSARANCKLTVTIPAATVGMHTIQGRNSAAEFAQTTYKVVSPTITIEPTCGPAGTVITVIGRGYTLQADAGIYVNTSLTRTNNYPDNAGNFATQVPVNVSGTGHYTIEVVNSLAIRRYATFTVPCTDVGADIDPFGDVQLVHQDNTTQLAVAGSPLKQYDTVTTGPDAGATITFPDGTREDVAHDSTVRTDLFTYTPLAPDEDASQLTLLRGWMRWVSGAIHATDQNNVVVQTPVGYIGLRGAAEFIAGYDPIAQIQTVHLASGSIAVASWSRLIPFDCQGPLTIVIDSAGVHTSTLTTAQYNAIKAQLFTTDAAPTSNGGVLTTNEDTAASSTLVASDPEGQPLTYGVVMNGTKGSATITNASTGAFTYTPLKDANGADSFTFKASDGTSDSNVSTMSVSIVPVNDPPVAIGSSLTTTVNAAASAVLSASDVDADALTFAIVVNAVKGTASITNAATGAFTYTPNPGTSGTDTFTFQAWDGLVLSNVATVSVTIDAGTNQPPIATNGALTTKEDRSVTGTLSGSDPEGRPLTFSIVSNGTKGSVTITNSTTGRFTYVPFANANGSDVVVFRVSDGTLYSNPATLAVTITPANDSPVAANRQFATPVNTSVTGALSATDVDGDPLSFAVVKGPAHGTAVMTNAATGAFTYTPKTGFKGTDSFTFKATDPSGAIGKATASIVVGP